jgi:DnaK suppressor protein
MGVRRACPAREKPGVGSRSRLELCMARPRSAADPRALEVAPVGRGEEDEALASRLPVLRAALEQQRRFRREQLALLEANGRAHESSADTDPSDHRDEERTHALREVDALVVAGARRALADIELALVRMHTGRYGLCRSCAARIPVCVLEAIPKTTLCLACQHRSELSSDQRTGARSRKRAPRRRHVASGRRR